jgi:hypothetical protein
VPVIEARHDQKLTVKMPQTLWVPEQIIVEDFDGDRAAVALVDRFEYTTHTSRADFLNEAVRSKLIGQLWC